MKLKCCADSLSSDFAVYTNTDFLCAHWSTQNTQTMSLETPALNVHGTPCHIWLVNVARSAWRRLSKCVFVPVLSRELEAVGASYSVRG